jgi:hypothetical protein
MTSDVAKLAHIVCDAAINAMKKRTRNLLRIWFSSGRLAAATRSIFGNGYTVAGRLRRVVKGG